MIRDFERAFLLERGNRRARNQEEPQEQTDKQRRLPDSAQVNVFVTLMSEPKPQTAGQLVHHRQPLPGHRTEHHDQQSAEQARPRPAFDASVRSRR